MKFCSYLINDVNFEPDAVQPCCNIRDLRVPRFAFSGGRLDMAAYKRHIFDVAGAIQEQRLCAGCPELREIEIPEGRRWNADIRFQTVSVNMHRNLCNCRCVYCDLWKTARPAAYEILPVLEDLRAQDALGGRCLISWGGGEPSVLPEFEEACAWATARGYPQYVHTSALLHSPAIEGLLRQNAGGVNISLDCGTPGTYRKVKGVDGFDKVVGTIGRYCAAASGASGTCAAPPASGASVHLKYIVFEDNNGPDDIENFFKICRAHNITAVNLSLDFREVNARRVSPATLKSAALFVLMAEKLKIHCTAFFIPDHYLRQIAR